MAVAFLPTLDGTTLPPPADQSYTRLYRGGTLTMASGKIVHDLVDDAARHRFTLNFVYLTATQLNSLQTLYHGLRSSTATFTDIRNLSYTVTRPEGGELDIQPQVTAGGDIKYHVSMELVEDS